MRTLKRILIVVGSVLALWFLGQVALREIARRKTGARIGWVSVDPFRGAVTASNIRAKGLIIKKLRVERPRVVGGLGARRVVVDGLDTVERILLRKGRLTVEGVRFYSADQSLRYVVDGLMVDTVSRVASIERAAMIPTYSREDFTPKSWNHGDWTQVELMDVGFFGLDLAAKKVDSVRISGGLIVSFKDRNTSKNDKPKAMYHAVLQRIMPKFGFRTVTFDGVLARYEELAVKAEEAGTISFADITGEARIAGDEFVWQARALVENSAPLDARGTLPLTGDNFEVRGNLGACRLSIFNPMAMPVGNVEIGDGRLRGLDFVITGDSIQAHADIVMAYENLYVELLNRRTRRERKLLSEIANDFILQPSFDGHESADFERDPMRSPWSYLWHTLFAAIKKTQGL